MIKCLLIDDEPLARSILLEYLAAYPKISVAQECSDGFEGLKAIREHEPDLLFLDVQMPKINGFEMLELAEPVPSVIFTTAFDEYALKAFETHAVDYLLKPFSQERFNNALDKWISQQQGKPKTAPFPEDAGLRQPEEQQRVVVKNGQDIRIIPVKEIQYIEAYDDYVKIHTREGFFLKKKTMQHYEKLLGNQRFVRVHRSYLLCLQELTRIETMEKDSHLALLRNGQRLPLSKSGYSRLKAVLGI